MVCKFLSRKFLVTLFITSFGLFAGFILPVWEPFGWLREYTPTIFAGLCGLAGLYLGANAWQKYHLWKGETQDPTRDGEAMEE